MAAVCLWQSAALACPVDCSGTNEVSVGDIRQGVEIALGRAALSSCELADVGDDGGVTVDELILGVQALLGTCPAVTPTPTIATSPPATLTPTPGQSVEPIFPADYRSTFVEVRNCRFSIEHGGVQIRVYANPIAAQPYLEEQNPLPVGSIVIKEEFDGGDCSDDADLTKWRVMRKEEPGFDPEDGDWHWQWVDRAAGGARSVRFDDKSTCIGCHLRPACLNRDYMCTEEGDAGTLQTVLQSQPAALLSVSGTSASDVYAVGADKTGTGPLVLHYDGNAWQKINTRASGDLWWVSVAPIDNHFYMSGSGGLLLSIDRATGNVQRLTPPTTALLYGVWGSSATDLWVVGGDANDDGVILHYDGVDWTPQDLSAVLPNGVPSLFKVWGRSANEVYAVGQRGTILRYADGAWSAISVTTPFTRPLFTVHGDATHVFAVGGFIDGSILELEGDAFVDHTPSGLPQMNGVFVGPLGQPSAVGLALSMARRSASGWELKQESDGSILDFHSTWVDPEGGVWAVGGDLLDDELNEGVLYYAGTRTISSVITQPPRCSVGESGPGGTVSYSGDVVPLLQQAGCLAVGCHGGAFPSSGYDLRTYTSSFKQGTEAQFVLDVCPIEPGDADASYLLEKVMASPRVGVRMPQNLPPLSEAQIDLIRTWILEGARNN